MNNIFYYIFIMYSGSVELTEFEIREQPVTFPILTGTK